MKILVLTKRQYMGKDLIDDCYGRFFEIPYQLSDLGNDVLGICLSYRKRVEGEFRLPTSRGVVRWVSINLGYNPLWGLHTYLSKVNQTIESFKPEIIWACSDAFHIINGVYLQRKHKIKCIVDLYDDFESFGATHFPGIRFLYNRSLMKASGITCVSNMLAKKLDKDVSICKNVKLLENAIPDGLFKPRDKYFCRKKLGLPENARFVGTAGAITSNRGIEILFDAFLELAQQDSSLYLLLAGPIDKSTTIPKHPKIIYLGNLEYTTIPIVYSAMDVAIICNKTSKFGTYCFPQKFYEILSCNVPVIAADIGEMGLYLSNYRFNKYNPDSSEMLVEAIKYQLNTPEVISLPILTWQDQARKLNQFMYDTYSSKEDSSRRPNDLS